MKKSSTKEDTAKAVCDAKTSEPMATTCPKEDTAKTVSDAKNSEPKEAMLQLKDKIYFLYEQALDTRDQCFKTMEENDKKKELLDKATNGLLILKDLEWKINLIPKKYCGAKKHKVADVFNDNLNEYLKEVSPMLEVCHAAHCKAQQHIVEFRKLLTDWQHEEEVADKPLYIDQFKNKEVRMFANYENGSMCSYNYQDHVINADDFTGYQPLWECGPKMRRFRDVDGDYYLAANPKTAKEYYDNGAKKARLTNGEKKIEKGSAVGAAGGYDSFGVAGSNIGYGAGGERNGVSKGAVAGGVLLSAVLGVLCYKAYQKYTKKE